VKPILSLVIGYALIAIVGTAASATAETVYDIQCGCYNNTTHAENLVKQLNDANLPWYTVYVRHCTCFIIDANIKAGGVHTFLSHRFETPDAIPVKNYWDIPPHNPVTCSPRPERSDFVDIMAPYMRRQYRNGYYNRSRRSMAPERARMYSGFIYDAAMYYGIDPFLLFAVANFETYFRNMKGDLDRIKDGRPDPAQGMFQILESTEKAIFQEMRRQKLPHAPDELPRNLLTHPKTQIYFAAHYLAGLHRDNFSNLYMVLRAYNGKHNANFEYCRKVMRIYERAVQYFVVHNHPEKVQSEATKTLFTKIKASSSAAGTPH